MLLLQAWDMMNNFCFHVYDQKLLLISENGNATFDCIHITVITRACDCAKYSHRASSQLNKNKST